MKVGFIGLGNMGAPMAANVLRAGFELTVYNRTPARAEDLVRAGARLASSPSEVAREAEVVLACLRDVSASLEVFLGREGVVEASRAGQVLVDHSTVDPSTTLRLHAACSARGASFLDAPVSGGPAGAREGSLSILVGGERGAFEKALPVLEAMGRRVVLLGGPGAGTAGKLVNQLLVGAHTLAGCEAVLLALRLGVDPAKLLPVLEASWGQSRMLERNAPLVLSGRYHPSGAPVRNLLKDLAIILELGREQGLALPAAEAAHRIYSALAAGGHGDWDIAAAATLLV